MGIEELRNRRDEILQVATRHGARHVRIFGSVARGDADEKSDVDFLVEMKKAGACWTSEACSWTSRIFSAGGWTW